MNGYYDPGSAYLGENANQHPNKHPYLYKGQFGKFAANQSPQDYYNFALGQAGLDPTEQSPFGAFLNKQYESLFSGYHGGQGQNKNLGFMQYMQRQFGAPKNPYESGESWQRFGDYMRNLYTSMTPGQRQDQSPGYTFNQAHWSTFG